MRAVSYATVPLASAGVQIKQTSIMCTLNPGLQDIV